MRPSRLVVGSVLTAALALVALPGLAGSHATSVFEPLPAGAFQPLPIPATTTMTEGAAVGGLDPTAVSDGATDARALVLEPGVDLPGASVARARLDQPNSAATSERRPPRMTLRGEATFYDAGFTAMRLPRGTVVVICGDGGCIERTVSDYGPVKPSRIVDLYRPDFFAVCGCPPWSGVVDVTVHVY